MQCEFPDGKINLCMDSTTPPHLYVLALLRFHIAKKQHVHFLLFFFTSVFRIIILYKLLLYIINPPDLMGYI